MRTKELIAAERPRPRPTAPLEGAPETGTGAEIGMGTGTGTGTGIKAGTKTKRRRSTRGGRDRGQGRSQSRGADTLFPVPTEDLEGPGKTRTVGGALSLICGDVWITLNNTESCFFSGRCRETVFIQRGHVMCRN